MCLPVEQFPFSPFPLSTTGRHRKSSIDFDLVYNRGNFRFILTFPNRSFTLGISLNFTRWKFFTSNFSTSPKQYFISEVSHGLSTHISQIYMTFRREEFMYQFYNDSVKISWHLFLTLFFEKN